MRRTWAPAAAAGEPSKAVDISGGLQDVSQQRFGRRSGAGFSKGEGRLDFGFDLGLNLKTHARFDLRGEAVDLVVFNPPLRFFSTR